MNMPRGCGVVAAEKEEIANPAAVRRLACLAIKLVSIDRNREGCA
jgi:hypothetical protein